MINVQQFVIHISYYRLCKMLKRKGGGKKRYLKMFWDVPNSDILPIQNYLELGGDISIVHKGSTFLCRAARYNNIVAIRFLIEAGSDITLCDENGSTPVYIAASHNHKNAIITLIEGWRKQAHQEDIPDWIDIPNLNGYTALYSAVKNGHLECAELLVSFGASIYSRNNQGHSMFYVAMTSLHLDFMKLFIDHGYNIREEESFSPTVYRFLMTHDIQLADGIFDSGCMRITNDILGLTLVYVLVMGWKDPDEKDLTCRFLHKLFCAGYPYDASEVGLRNVQISNKLLAHFKNKSLNPDLVHALHEDLQELGQPPSLLRLCRLATRRSLSASRCRAHIHYKIEQLVLPSVLKKMLTYETL